MSRLWVAVIIAVIVIGGIVAFYFLQPETPKEVVQPPKPVQSAETQIPDPRGDVGSAPPILDIVAARVAKLDSNQVSFEVAVAGQIPKEPEGFVAYAWFLTSGITTVDRPAIALVYDDQARRWDALILNGTGTGNPQRIRTFMKGLVYTISGDTAKVTVPLDVLGNPSTFN